jgi:hypothetical protein
MHTNSRHIIKILESTMSKSPKTQKFFNKKLFYKDTTMLLIEQAWQEVKEIQAALAELTTQLQSHSPV